MFDNRLVYKEGGPETGQAAEAATPETPEETATTPTETTQQLEEAAEMSNEAVCEMLKKSNIQPILDKWAHYVKGQDDWKKVNADFAAAAPNLSPSTIQKAVGAGMDSQIGPQTLSAIAGKLGFSYQWIETPPEGPVVSEIETEEGTKITTQSEVRMVKASYYAKKEDGTVDKSKLYHLMDDGSIVDNQGQPVEVTLATLVPKTDEAEPAVAETEETQEQAQEAVDAAVGTINGLKREFAEWKLKALRAPAGSKELEEAMERMHRIQDDVERHLKTVRAYKESHGIEVDEKSLLAS